MGDELLKTITPGIFLRRNRDNGHLDILQKKNEKYYLLDHNSLGPEWVGSSRGTGYGSEPLSSFGVSINGGETNLKYQFGLEGVTKTFYKREKPVTEWSETYGKSTIYKGRQIDNFPIETIQQPATKFIKPK
ncbi:MAG: hypothetical protein VKJ06_00640 [Vampirovibrionales bacterium]|nr:hypothetical protein [Vampirovibrionales bacterium]